MTHHHLETVVIEFAVDGIRRESVCEMIRAVTRQDAVIEFRRRQPLFTPDAVTEIDSNACHEHVGRCEGCSVDLFDTDSYSLTSEGEHYLCTKCLPK